MFKEEIRSTEFVNGWADEYFSNIIEVSGENDVSFISTLRALLYKRISSTETVEFYHNKSSFSAASFSNTSKSVAFSALSVYWDRLKLGLDLHEDKSQIYLHDVLGNKEDINENFKVIRSQFLSTHEGFSEVKKVEEFFRKRFSVSCYVNVERKVTFIFMGGALSSDLRNLHYIQTGIPLFLPWYFQSDLLSSEEMELISSLGERTSQKYMSLLGALSQKNNFREGKIRKELRGFGKKSEELKLKQAEEKYTSVTTLFNNLNNDIHLCIDDMNSIGIEILGLKEKINSNISDTEMIEYFIANKSLKLISTGDDWIRFAVETYISYFDRELAERAIANEHSFVYGSCSRLSKTQIGELMTEIFVADNPQLKIKTTAAYILNAHRGVSASKLDNVPHGFIQNPHIGEFSCIGGYVIEINKLLMKYDYVGAIEQCVASCKSLNFADGIVIQHFIKDFLQSEISCIETPNKEVITVEEAVDWLREKG